MTAPNFESYRWYYKVSRKTKKRKTKTNLKEIYSISIVYLVKNLNMQDSKDLKRFRPMIQNLKFVSNGQYMGYPQGRMLKQQMITNKYEKH